MDEMTALGAERGTWSGMCPWGARWLVTALVLVGGCSGGDVITEGFGSVVSGEDSGVWEDSSESPMPQLTVELTGTGGGRIEGPGVDCTDDCTQAVTSGAELWLAATPDGDSSFIEWIGCDEVSDGLCAVAPRGDRTIEARFEVNYEVEVFVVGDGEVTGNGLECSGSLCSGIVASGTTLTLTATPDLHRAFAAWEGCSSTVPTCSVTVTEDLEITAIFEPVEYVDILVPTRDNLVMISSVDDAVEDTAYPNAWLGVGCNWTYWFVWNIQWQDFVCGQGLVQFDTSSLAGATIVSATLELEAATIGVGFHPRSFDLRAMATAWSDDVTWNDVESSSYYLNSEIVLNPPVFIGQTYSVDVTDYVENWVSGSWSNHGIKLGSTNYLFPYATSFDAFEFWDGADVTLTVAYEY